MVLLWRTKIEKDVRLFDGTPIAFTTDKFYMVK